MSLRVDLFENFKLNNPIWIASSHLSESVNVLKYWQKINPSAITLKSTSAKGGQGLGDRFLRKIGQELSLYSDGEKRKEFLDYETSMKLLKVAKRLLPNSKIGSSILMEEDYSKCLNLLKESDFFELNLKYSARSKAASNIHSKFKADKIKYEKILNEIHTFLDVFKKWPCFIKFTRETDWISDCDEFDRVITLIKSYPRVGIILANTKKWIIPSSSSGLAVELSGGIMAGSKLFEETYNIIKRVNTCVPKSIPIVATGGINSIQSAIDMFKIGAKAIQLCTVLQLRGLYYYDYLSEGFRNIQRQMRVKSFNGLLKKLQNTNVVYLPPLFDYCSNFYKYSAFSTLFKSKTLDMIVVYARTFTRENLSRFIARFRKPNLTTRIITMAYNSPSLKATAYSLGRGANEMGQKIKDMHQYWIEIYKKHCNQNHSFEIFQHKKVPFHSGYITEKSALFVPYSLLGEGKDLPIYEFDASTNEYKRLKDEFNGLLKDSTKVFSSKEQ